MKSHYFAAAVLSLIASPLVAGADTGTEEKPRTILGELAKSNYVESEHTIPFEGAFEGKKLMCIYFTAKWCGPCRQFTPKLIKIRDQYKDDFQFIMASWDKDLDSQLAYLEKTKMNVPALRFDDAFSKKLNGILHVRGVPTLAVFDATSGHLIAEDGRNQMLQLLQPETLKAIPDTPAGDLWKSIIKPYQDELMKTRAKHDSDMAPVFEANKDFPFIGELREAHGYAGGSAKVGRILRRAGMTVALDWEHQSHHVDQLIEMAPKLKPNVEKWRGMLEGSGTRPFFEGLGAETGNNPKITEKLMDLSENGRSSTARSGAIVGLTCAAVQGNKDAYEMVAHWKTKSRWANGPLQFAPALTSYSRKGNLRAIQLAKAAYDEDDYYVYSFFPVFMQGAFQGNAVAMDILEEIHFKTKNKEYAEGAVTVLENCAKDGIPYARIVLDRIAAKEAKEAVDKPAAAKEN